MMRRGQTSLDLTSLVPRDYYRMAGELSGGIGIGRGGSRTRLGRCYFAGVRYTDGVGGVSELDGTPTIAAPSRAAAAVTASRTVFKFTARLLAFGGMQGMCRLSDPADKVSRSN